MPGWVESGVRVPTCLVWCLARVRGVGFGRGAGSDHLPLGFFVGVGISLSAMFCTFLKSSLRELSRDTRILLWGILWAEICPLEATPGECRVRRLSRH